MSKNVLEEKRKIDDAKFWIKPKRHLFNEYNHTVIIATDKLSKSEAKPRCYDNFESDSNRVVIFLISTCSDHFKIEHSNIVTYITCFFHF